MRRGQLVKEIGRRDKTIVYRKEEGMRVQEEGTRGQGEGMRGQGEGG